jgi:hypothetical protein
VVPSYLPSIVLWFGEETYHCLQYRTTIEIRGNKQFHLGIKYIITYSILPSQWFY